MYLLMELSGINLSFISLRLVKVRVGIDSPTFKRRNQNIPWILKDFISPLLEIKYQKIQIWPFSKIGMDFKGYFNPSVYYGSTNTYILTCRSIIAAGVKYTLKSIPIFEKGLLCTLLFILIHLESETKCDN